MSGKAATCSDKSEKSIPLAEHEDLKLKYETLVREHELKYETLVREHETLIKTLELLEKTHGINLESLTKNQREEIVAKEEIEKWENKFGEMQKMLEMAQKDIKDLMLKETEMNDSGSEPLAEDLNVNNNNNNIELDKDMIVISDDDEESPRESNRPHVYSSHKNPKFSFLL